MISRPTESGRRSAFTLIELLVVIGIIVILLAILLPVAGRVRIHAQTTRTIATMTSIGGACERYFSVEHAYPGLVTNAQLATGVAITTNPAVTGAGSELTSTENLSASLSGGFMPDATGNPDFTNVSLDPTSTPKVTIGTGPMHFGPVPMNRTRATPYIEGPVGNLLPQPPYSGTGCVALNAELIGVKMGIDTAFPEYMDNYSVARPIIYLRANNNANGIATPMTQKPLSPIAQYNTFEFTRYQRGAAADTTSFPGDFQWNKVFGDFEFYKDEVEYLRSPNLNNMPRGHNKFILISAGPDRCFGTKDDIFYGAN